MTRRRYFPTIRGPSSRYLILYRVLCSQILSLQQPPSPPLDPLPSSFSFAESWSCRDADLPRLPAARGPAPLAIPWSPARAPKSCRARRSGGPPPCRRKELPRPRPLGPPRGAAARGGPARPRPAVVRSCRCVFGSSDPPAGSSAPRPACYPAALRTLSGTPPALVVRLLFISFY